MKQEPVAWAIKSDGDFTEIGWDDETLEEVKQMYTTLGWNYEYIPLYTEPQYRELSDEEIYELYAGPVTSDREMVEFAHAILKKASEK